MSQLKLCKKCYQNNEPICHGYIAWLKDDCYECPMCKNRLEDTCITREEYKVIDKISDDIAFLEAMIKLKEENLIEFQFKMSQFKTQLQQKEKIEQIEKESSKPKCPHCHSTNIKSISGLNRGASIAILGIFSKKINKSFECKNCGYTW